MTETITGLADLLDRRALLPGLAAVSQSDVITALGRKLEMIGKVHGSYVGAVLSREGTMPTGLPLDAIHVAIPHTDPIHVISPAVAVATLNTPVTFASMEDPDEWLPVRVVFLLALNDKHRQLAMLQQIAALIQDGPRLTRIVDAPDVDTLWHELAA
ncbi:MULTISPECIES: PTS sugar transporter subunit IIA [Acidiphilium]|uniref:PTS system IIA component, Gat family n=1 Tax=Acidiphilium rubrum TaxID=526 RepID=A0A8G2CK47_ACIRU|nr:MULTISPECIES: PTS sugar transporter subunit IIA [Acidiphilium]SIQ69141.1 PTS system IIA component, Gat family [Acidiphilium rubrum]